MSCLTWLTYWWNLRPAPAMGSLYASLEERCNQARSDEALHLDTIVRQMQTAGSVRLDDIEAVARIRSRLGTRFASLDDLYFRSIREAVLIDGYITPDRAQWLRDLLCGCCKSSFRVRAMLARTFSTWSLWIRPHSASAARNVRSAAAWRSFPGYANPIPWWYRRTSPPCIE